MCARPVSKFAAASGGVRYKTPFSFSVEKANGFLMPKRKRLSAEFAARVGIGGARNIGIGSFFDRRYGGDWQFVEQQVVLSSCASDFINPDRRGAAGPNAVPLWIHSSALFRGGRTHRCAPTGNGQPPAAVSKGRMSPRRFAFPVSALHIRRFSALSTKFFVGAHLRVRPHWRQFCSVLPLPQKQSFGSKETHQAREKALQIQPLLQKFHPGERDARYCVGRD